MQVMQGKHLHHMLLLWQLEKYVLSLVFVVCYLLFKGVQATHAKRHKFNMHAFANDISLIHLCKHVAYIWYCYFSCTNTRQHASEPYKYVVLFGSLVLLTVLVDSWFISEDFIHYVQSIVGMDWRYNFGMICLGPVFFCAIISTHILSRLRCYLLSSFPTFN